MAHKHDAPFVTADGVLVGKLDSQSDDICHRSLLRMEKAQETLDWIVEQMLDHVPHNLIEKRLMQQGQVKTDRQARKWIKRAKWWARVQMRTTVKRELLKAVRWYNKIADDKTKKTCDRIEARKQLDKLMGLVTHRISVLSHSTKTHRHEIHAEKLQQYADMLKGIGYVPNSTDSQDQPSGVEAGPIPGDEASGRDGSQESVPAGEGPSGPAVHADSEASAVLGL